MITEAQKRLYFEGRANGLSIQKAARGAGFSESTAKRIELKHPDRGNYRLAARNAREMPDPLKPRDLKPEARRALEDFGYFQRRYLGRIPMPWQDEAAQIVVKLLETPNKEYVVVNGPPGSGKTSLFSYALPLWLTARDRAIRGLIGSVTGRMAVSYTQRIRRVLEAVTPIMADDEDRLKGIAIDAEATLSEDFGRFKPVDHESWTKDAFIVEQQGGASLTEKEPTWTAVGRDQEFIGGRYDFCMWDDLASLRRMRSIEMIEADRDWWDSYAERRLEPGGLLMNQAQRLNSEDISHYCLSMKVPVADDDEGSDEAEELHDGDEVRKYHHIKFKAHYEDRCLGDHKVTAKPYPEGCLLDPRRVTWRELRPIMHNRPDTFAVVYQQEDVAASEVLVPKIWIDGNGSEFPGCWDKDRDRLELPKGLAGPLWSVMSCDPSPTRFWGIQWWVFAVDSDQRFLMDLERRAMDADDFLDWNNEGQAFTGLLEEWYQTSVKLGIPITHVIVEVNAAQRFLLQFDHVRRWMMRTNVEIVPHSTHSNKSNPDYGVQTLRPHYRFGRVRLPGKGEGRICSLKLVDEVTRYPKASTDDEVMAEWFTEWQYPNIYIGTPVGPTNAWRPSWMSRSA